MQDSAEYWARECMRMKPLCYDPVKILVRKYSKENRYDISDTIITNYISKYKFNKNSYLDLIDVKLKLNQKEEILHVLDSALYYFPDDLTFIKKREEIDKNNEEK